MNFLEGKVAIVTGGARGIGAAVAMKLAEMGANVTITFVSASSESKAEELVGKINNLGNGARAIKIQSDAATVDSPKTVVSKTLEAFGPSIDILVNNAGTGLRKAFLETTVKDFDDAINVNLRAAFFMSQAVVPHLRRPGRIINISSIVSRTGGPLYGVYAASKAGLEGFTRSLAAAVGPYGHSVNAVLPGLTDTDMLTKITEDEESAHFHKMVAAATPMEGRVASPEEIAHVVAYLAGSQSQWITGQCISATGGLLMV
ncbi:short-chain dehydrogenase/reductase-like protein SDR [Clohesyomyces aquaticus]|uniref:Short-chain dehydrogenase/reductase-like protein SDR n=1 Tax=Clohesyomyces aquaticus TaxID=1231657 RepID=A0A1Y1Z0T2_9PLEO|nr:short-chain dehydrogenase/reductase-like protein SDR [Clohesyomyces aquaticus]